MSRAGPFPASPRARAGSRKKALPAAADAYHSRMVPSRSRHKRRRHSRRKRQLIFLVGVLALAAVALVAVIMYGLTSMNWRARY